MSYCLSAGEGIKWKKKHQTDAPKIFLKISIESWNFPMILKA